MKLNVQQRFLGKNSLASMITISLGGKKPRELLYSRLVGGRIVYGDYEDLDPIWTTSLLPLDRLKKPLPAAIVQVISRIIKLKETSRAISQSPKFMSTPKPF